MSKIETGGGCCGPVGAIPTGDGTLFRAWAPDAPALAVVIDGKEHALEPEAQGWWSGVIREAPDGTLYDLRLGDAAPCPDPASRYQPFGPTGSSMVVDPRRYSWNDQEWSGVTRHGHVVYELHIGTFTRDGSFAAAAERLPHLAELGVTLLEVMPVGDFAGTFGWGYDGVSWFAPTRLYGRPDDFRRFVDAAHGLGIGVILDVVYNHFGPIGSFHDQFAKAWFTDRYANDWGESLAFEGPAARPVRDHVVANARMWIDEYHLDGLRLDAVQNIYDFESTEPIVAELAREARAAAGGRGIWIVGECEPQLAALIRSKEDGGAGLDALWNDDWHHTARVALTGRSEAYFTDYGGKPQEFISAAKRGFLYQGQRYHWQKQPRGTPTSGVDPEQFVVFLQNHDQIANSGRGLPLCRTTHPAALRAMTALLLLGPNTPMLFQGQEFASTKPFWYFAELVPELAELVAQGRVDSGAQFPSLARPDMRGVMQPPAARATFEGCQLDWGEVERHGEVLVLHRDLIRLRREDPSLRAARRAHGVDGAVLSAEAFVLRFFGRNGDDRLLLINLGADLRLTIMPEPLLAPPEGSDWTCQWSSEAPEYGGSGHQPPTPDATWVLAGRAACLLRPGPPSSQRRTEQQKALGAASPSTAHHDDGDGP
ncbi:MAG: malto-oligosyltrehalose trehalohydrolase [Geminicoccaceae bacterium]